MKRKIREALADLLAGAVLLLLLITFALCFLFDDNLFFPCVVAGILAATVLAAILWGKELDCE